MNRIKNLTLSRIVLYALCLTIAGCAGFSRGCASCTAQSFGADWVVVQADLHGKPFRCWELRNVSISNEEHSDGIYWVDTQSGNLVHLAGHYNRVQVVGNNWSNAFEHVGLTKAACEYIYSLQYNPVAREYEESATERAKRDRREKSE